MEALPITRLPRSLGASSLARFPIAYGCWRLVGDDVRAARAKLEAALELGINLFDLADVYGLDHGGSAFGESEALFGRVLGEAPSLRDRMLIATKGGIVPGVPYDSSAAHLLARLRRVARAACASSASTSTRSIVPTGSRIPRRSPPRWSACATQGKVREVGVSNFTPAQVDALQRYLPFRLATQQPEFSCWNLAPLARRRARPVHARAR